MCFGIAGNGGAPRIRAGCRSRHRDAVTAPGAEMSDAAEPRLALSEEEHPLLYDRVAELDRVRRALHEALPGTGVSLLTALAVPHRPLGRDG